MKFDIARAWKDETYRQSLSNEQSSTLPTNPAGELELSNADLEAVNGGNGFGIGGASSAFSQESHFHSLALRCDENAFSLTVVHGFNLLSPVNAFCINDDEHNGRD